MKQWIAAAPGGHKARVRYPNGKTRSKTCPTVREARAWLRRTLTEIDAGTNVPDSSGKLLFIDWGAVRCVERRPGARHDQPAG